MFDIKMHHMTWLDKLNLIFVKKQVMITSDGAIEFKVHKGINYVLNYLPPEDVYINPTT
jgi:hypothetical protein